MLCVCLVIAVSLSSSFSSSLPLLLGILGILCWRNDRGDEP